MSASRSSSRTAAASILYEIVAGEALHARRSVGEALTQPAARPSTRRSDAPPELDAIRHRARRAGGRQLPAPWVLELVGVLTPTCRFTAAGELVLGSAVVRFSALPVQRAFAALLVILLAVVGLLSRGLAERQREATRGLELHAWHLRQVVPTVHR